MLTCIGTNIIGFVLRQLVTEEVLTWVGETTPQNHSEQQEEENTTHAKGSDVGRCEV